MMWMPFSHGLRLGPIAKGSPEALVVLLHDLGTTAATLSPVAARWATSVPTTAFIVLNEVERLDSPFCVLSSSSTLDDGAEPTLLDRAAHHLETLLEEVLRTYRLDARRLVLVGFGYGGMLALHLLLRQGWSCAGVLAYAAQMMRPLSRAFRVDSKVRLIEFASDAHIDGLREKVALLTACGIDTRGVRLASAALTDEAIRHGGAYLVELVATAQRSPRLRADRKSRLGNSSSSVTRLHDASTHTRSRSMRPASSSTLE